MLLRLRASVNRLLNFFSVPPGKDKDVALCRAA
jgi:hypothetical protein